MESSASCKLSSRLVRSCRKVTMSKIRMGNTGVDYDTSGEKMFAPSVARNKQFICDLLSKYSTGYKDGSSVLEVACGTGEHTACFAAAMPNLVFQPTDYETDLFGSVTAHSQGLDNVRAPQQLDTSNAEQWIAVISGLKELSAIVCINMTHISPYTATLGLIAAAGEHLQPGGLLFVYGPFTTEGGKHTSDSNIEFDANLRERNPLWGYRDIEAIKLEAAARGLKMDEVASMPANNFSLIFKKS